MELTDTALTLRLKEHDESAFEALFRRYYGYLYSIAIHYVKDPDLAEDAVSGNIPEIMDKPGAIK